MKAFPQFLAVLMVLAPAALPGREQPDVLLGMSSPWELAQRPAEWQQTAEGIDELLLFIDEVAAADIEDLRALAAHAREHGYTFAIELGGLVEWRAVPLYTAAEMSFADEWAKVERLVRPVESGGAGGRVTSLHLDGPMRRMLYPEGKELTTRPLESTVRELGEVCELWRHALPDAERHLLVNFPNWGWSAGPAYHDFGYTTGRLGWGDYEGILQLCVQAAQSAGAPFAGLVVDNPLDYATGTRPSNQPGEVVGVDWMRRLVDLEATARGHGLEVRLIVNCETSATGPEASDAAYAAATLEYVERYLAAGGQPDAWVVESWYPRPERWLPESDPSTMAGIGLAVLGRVQRATE
jgi:hypothetical protein